MTNGIRSSWPDPDVLNRAILELASGTPEWVLVDRRVLRVLLGPLADLLVQIPYDTASGRVLAREQLAGGDEHYVWEDDDLCP